MATQEEIENELDSVEERKLEAEGLAEYSGYDELREALFDLSCPGEDDAEWMQDILDKIFDSYEKCVEKGFDLESKKVLKQISQDKFKTSEAVRRKCDEIWENCLIDTKIPFDAKRTSQVLKTLEDNLKKMQSCEKKLAEF